MSDCVNPKSVVSEASSWGCSKASVFTKLGSVASSTACSSASFSSASSYTSPTSSIASGGAGTVEHLHEGLASGHASAVLAASIFHYRELTIRQCKEYLRDRGIPVRL